MLHGRGKQWQRHVGEGKSGKPWEREVIVNRRRGKQHHHIGEGGYQKGVSWGYKGFQRSREVLEI